MLTGIPGEGVLGNNPRLLHFPCQLDSSILPSLIEQYPNDFVGKFVFHVPTKNMAISTGGAHRDIANEIFKGLDINLDRRQIVGGIIILRNDIKENNTFELRFQVGSGHFYINKNISSLKPFIEELFIGSDYKITSLVIEDDHLSLDAEKDKKTSDGIRPR